MARVDKVMGKSRKRHLISDQNRFALRGLRNALN